jgi:hypothetical protein
MLLSYSTIFSRVLGRINDPKELLLSEEDWNALYVERLHNVVGNPRVSNIFSTLVLHEVDIVPPNDGEAEETQSEDETENEDEFTEDTIEYELKNPADEYSDNEYVIQVLVTGIVIEWLRPKVETLEFTKLMIGGKEEKKLLDPYNNMSNRLGNLEKQLHKLIRDRGYIHNEYVDVSEV